MLSKEQAGKVLIQFNVQIQSVPDDDEFAEFDFDEEEFEMKDGGGKAMNKKPQQVCTVAHHLTLVIPLRTKQEPCTGLTVGSLTIFC